MPCTTALPSATVVWVVVGGLAYTLGSFVFLSNRPYAHTVWHLFVIAGSVCHFFAALWYAVPALRA